MLRKLITAVCICLLLIGCGKDAYVHHEKADMTGYRFLEDRDHAYEKVTFGEAADILENGTGVLYFGRPGCPWCQRIVPVLNEAAKEYRMPIYYADCGQISGGEEPKYFEQILEMCDDFLSKGEDGRPQFYIPFVVGVKDGVIKDAHEATVEGFRIEDSDSDLSKEQREELRGIYETIFRKTGY